MGTRVGRHDSSARAPSAVSPNLLADLERMLGPGKRNVAVSRVSVRPSDRAAYGRDLWPRLLLGLGTGIAAPYPPDVVVWPETLDEVVALVRYAGRYGIPLVPFGGGSGVCGSALPISGGMVIDLKRMNRTVGIDAERMEATFEAGILGEHLEHRLNREGLTLGHFPSSITISTLGGWLATRSAGQASSRYGKIEDMTLGFTFVTGAGDVLAVDGATGPDYRGLFIGSEGTLGIFTEARLRISPLAPSLHYAGWSFDSLAQGLDAIRHLAQMPIAPTVLRLYDEAETLLHGLSSASSKGKAAGGHGSEGGPPAEPKSVTAQTFASSPRELAFVSLANAKRKMVHAGLEQAPFLNRVLASSAAQWMARRMIPEGKATGARLIIGFEGSAEETSQAATQARSVLELSGARDLGEAPGRAWLANRYKVSFEQSKIFCQGAFVDTMEVATTWDRLATLYAAVRAAASRHVLVMAHFSHVYAEGCSIYFTFVGTGSSPGEDEAGQAIRRYDRLWRSVLRATLKAGGVVSHHHGIGLLKQEFMVEEVAAGMALLRAAKQVLDPRGICNPGKLGLS